ncbi:MAG TPA: 16S rRNA (uracil(1498)-N(3))-methyltransferase [Aestuariivirgaceae bacterium]|nr:16S rRNA (uracil(1498)-N(3))-methyltransferase [Aestuariivirgaceae bacterium]
MVNLARIPRLYVDAPLATGTSVTLNRQQSHYVANVMRLKSGDALRLFNGRDGEYLCTIETAGKRDGAVTCTEQTARHREPPDLDYIFAPLKHARLDYMAQKATEMGVRRLRPVFTERTISQRVNLDRLEANTIEAAEQCNMVTVPEVLPPEPLDAVLANWDPSRRLIVCDEAAPIADPLAALKAVPSGPLALLVGPEGGFTEAEAETLRALAFVTAISLGPRIMRADTAAVAALALVQAVHGDWSEHQQD